MPAREAIGEMRLTVEAGLTALVAPRVARLRPESMHRVLEAHLRRPRSRRTGRTRRDIQCSDERLMHIVDRVLNRMPRRSRNWCLVRGITAYRLLRANDRDVQLVFGARVCDGNLEAHCWLSDGVKPIHERPAPGEPFDEMFRITPAGVIIPVAH